MKVRLAEALLRRKELQEKVDQLRPINKEGLFETRIRRQNVTENVDDVAATVPKISMQQVAHAFDWHAKQLRRVDAAIQQANWNTELDVDQEVMADYVDPYHKEK